MEPAPRPAPDASLLEVFCDHEIGQTLAGTSFVKPGELAKVLAEPFLANPRVIRRAIRRLGLLLQVEPARKALEKHLGPNRLKDRRRFLLWLAGVERFRAFRHFLRSATEQQQDAVNRIATGYTTATDAQVSTAHPFVNAPGFAAFYQAISGPGLDRPGIGQHRSVRGWSTFADLDAAPEGTVLTTLQEFDYLLRLVGL